MVRVLQELASLDGGGVAKIVYDYYKYMDHSKVHFDFLIYDYYEKGIYEDEVLKMGSKIYKCTAYQHDKQKYFQEIEEVFKNNQYDVFHSHIGPQSIFSMRLAKKYGIPKRYIHSHLARRIGNTLRQKCSVWLQDRISMHWSTGLFACGKEAAKARYGKKYYESGKVRIMTNAIDTIQFKFDEEKRKEIRETLGIENQFVLGIVGRLENQKNYPFLLEVLKELISMDSNIVLLVIGRGEKEQEIRKKAKQLEVESYIHFLGVRNDVPDLLNALDIFVLPSLYEGLPIVLVEAQANGLVEIASNKITNEMEVTDLIHFLPINDAKLWAQTILQYKDQKRSREEYATIVANNGYDISKEAKKMEDFYLGGKSV